MLSDRFRILETFQEVNLVFLSGSGQAGVVMPFQDAAAARRANASSQTQRSSAGRHLEGLRRGNSGPQMSEGIKWRHQVRLASESR